MSSSGLTLRNLLCMGLEIGPAPERSRSRTPPGSARSYPQSPIIGSKSGSGLVVDPFQTTSQYPTQILARFKLNLTLSLHLHGFTSTRFSGISQPFPVRNKGYRKSIDLGFDLPKKPVQYRRTVKYGYGDTTTHFHVQYYFFTTHIYLYTYIYLYRTIRFRLEWY